MSDEQQKDRGEWIETYTGKRFYILDPQPEDISIQDIAKALSNECRFGGHAKVFYSVAQHSVIASSLGGLYHVTVRDQILEMQLALLLHDSAEAYLKDFPRPIKKMFPEIDRVQDKIQKVVLTKYGVGHYMTHPMTLGYIKEVDNALLGLEGKLFMRSDPIKHWPSCNNILELRGLDIQPWSPRVAREHFLQVFHTLIYKLGWND